VGCGVQNPRDPGHQLIHQPSKEIADSGDHSGESSRVSSIRLIGSADPRKFDQVIDTYSAFVRNVLYAPQDPVSRLAARDQPPPDLTLHR
jgi:hypothetical protein